MKKLALFVCLLVVTVAAQAQFEKGKWILQTFRDRMSLSGELSQCADKAEKQNG